MGKGKGRKVGGGGPTRSHGPKRHMHRWCGPHKTFYSKSGLLNKYHDFESWQLACTARGKRSATYGEFQEFLLLPPERQRSFFKELKR